MYSTYGEDSTLYSPCQRVAEYSRTSARDDAVLRGFGTQHISDCLSSTLPNLFSAFGHSQPILLHGAFLAAADTYLYQHHHTWQQDGHLNQPVGFKHNVYSKPSNIPT